MTSTLPAGWIQGFDSRWSRSARKSLWGDRRLLARLGQDRARARFAGKLPDAYPSQAPRFRSRISRRCISAPLSRWPAQCQ